MACHLAPSVARSIAGHPIVASTNMPSLSAVGVLTEKPTQVQPCLRAPSETSIEKAKETLSNLCIVQDEASTPEQVTSCRLHALRHAIVSFDNLTCCSDMFSQSQPLKSMDFTQSP